MNLTFYERRQVEIVAISCTVPFDDQDEIPADFPGASFFPKPDRYGNLGAITLVLDFASRKVRHWPAGRAADLYLKPRDLGRYELLGPNGEVVATRRDYVPQIAPRDGDDYFTPEIRGDGLVLNWMPLANYTIQFGTRSDSGEGADLWERPSVTP